MLGDLVSEGEEDARNREEELLEGLMRGGEKEVRSFGR